MDIRKTIAPADAVGVVMNLLNTDRDRPQMAWLTWYDGLVRLPVLTAVLVDGHGAAWINESRQLLGENDPTGDENVLVMTPAGEEAVLPGSALTLTHSELSDVLTDFASGTPEVGFEVSHGWRQGRPPHPEPALIDVPSTRTEVIAALTSLGARADGMATALTAIGGPISLEAADYAWEIGAAIDQLVRRLTAPERKRVTVIGALASVPLAGAAGAALRLADATPVQALVMGVVAFVLGTGFVAVLGRHEQPKPKLIDPPETGGSSIERIRAAVSVLRPALHALLDDLERVCDAAGAAGVDIDLSPSMIAAVQALTPIPARLTIWADHL
ncbi:hypothetical protein Afil01_69350 [Actinorhabdospora filicis]|uniref:Uncharacterized protein n=1 Tax=Actinorhabdospora filicis TaxID=1785913 RepID=A0A9W6STP2_9ACTN|nr:hypothetical protein [Actinorhabdospora filicis]GLZ82128.1 hypothetical protein Afil01_69350 [Actinorhabdospora filicis]